MPANGHNIADEVRDTIYKACLYQDDQKWDEWLDLCDENFQYAIKAFSPEIQYDMTYLNGSRDDLKTMMDMLPKHNSDHSPLKRHCVVYAVDVADDGASAEAVSSVTVFQTMLDGINSHVDAGETRVFLAGRYVDKFKIDGNSVKFSERVVQLETRRMDKGSHWPI